MANSFTFGKARAHTGLLVHTSELLMGKKSSQKYTSVTAQALAGKSTKKGVTLAVPWTLPMFGSLR